MRHFFLLCTMLIITSEAFQKDLYGGQTSASVRRKTSRFLPRDRHLKSAYQNSPVNLATYLKAQRRHDTPLMYTKYDRQRSGWKPVSTARCPRRYSFRTKKRISRKIRPKKRFFSTYNPLQYFEKDKDRVQHLNFFPKLLQVNPSVTEVARGVTYPKVRSKVPFTKENQCVVCFFHLFNRNSPRFVRRRKRRRLSNQLNDRRTLECSKCLKEFDKLRIKNKRSANTTKDKVQSKRSKGEVSDVQSSESPKSKSISKLRENSRHQQKLELSKSSTDESPNCQKVTTLSATTAKVPLEISYNPKLQESSLKSDDTFSLSSSNDEEEDKGDEKSEQTKDASEGEDEDETAEEVGQRYSSGKGSTNLGKLKHMLEEVEHVLKEESQNLVAVKGKDKAVRVEKTADIGGIKSKIDKVAIPVLKEISEELAVSTKESDSGKEEEGQKKEESQKKEEKDEDEEDKKGEKKKDEKKSKEKEKKTKGKSKGKDTKEKKGKLGRGCSPDGTWSSAALGLEFNLKIMPNMMIKVTINSQSEGMINKKWSVQGMTLTKRGGPLILAAIFPQKRRIAAFIGQCRSCQEQDYIFGSWTIGKCGGRLTDLWTSTETKPDVFRRSG